MKSLMFIDGYYVTYLYTRADPGDREHAPMGCEVEVVAALDSNGLKCDRSLFDGLADKVHARILDDKWDREF